MWALSLPFATFGGGVLGFLSASVRIFPSLGMIVLFALLAFTFTTVGAVVASRRPENPIGWIFCAGGLVLSVTASAINYAEYAVHATSAGSLPGVEYAAWIASWALAPTLLLVATMLFLLFPDGKPSSREWDFVVCTAVVASVMVALGDALGRENAGTDLGSIANPVAVGGAVDNIMDMLGGFGFVFLILCFLASVAAPFVRLSQARGQER
jgi:Na+-transporting methylmalonyl-CoA/oxaloacetate decarboxylase gamma subunit